MSDFVEVAKVAEVPASGKLCVELDDRFLLIVRVEGQYFCLDDVCTHDGGALGDGELDGYCIACPRHGAKFDVRDGSAVTMPATEPTGSHQVRIDGEAILIKLAEE
ncbi:MAG: non-heme iron oxygenase ferredoxin subunit [Aureliella sp.]